MAVTKIPYKGKILNIDERKDGTATVTIDGRSFECMHHDVEVGLPMWMCAESYFGAYDLVDLAKHFADYGYMFDDPNRVVVDRDGKTVDKPKATPKKKGK